MSSDGSRVLEQMITNLTNPRIKYVPNHQEVTSLLNQIKPVFLSEPSLLELQPPINIVGDIHGQFNDLLRLFALDKMPPASRYLFLGDYVDRGPQGLEVMCLLIALKLRYPSNVYLLRGNHETKDMTEIYGFAQEMQTKINRQCYNEFIDMFDTMPFGALIKGQIICVHGGLSPLLQTVDQIRQIQRPFTIGDSGMVSDIVWSDCDKAVDEWSESERGKTCKWGLKPAKKFLEANHLSLFVRAHQMAMDGVEYPFSPARCVVTVFSAPNYAGEFRNRGAFLKIDKNMKIATVILSNEIAGPTPPPVAGASSSPSGKSLTTSMPIGMRAGTPRAGATGARKPLRK